MLQPKRSTADVLAADSIYTSFNLTAPWMHPQTAAWLDDLDFTDSDEVRDTVNSGPAVVQDYLLIA